jgi:short-subunit dehydrogenase
VPGKFTDTTWEQQRDMVQVMVVALAELTHRLLPGMIERRYGRIVNVASVAGLVPQSAGHPLYGASKSLVIQFSQSIALEGMPHNVYTTALCPGFTYSEFHDVNGMREQVSELPSWMWMDAGTVARQAFDAVMAGRILYVNGRVNRAMVLLARYLPRWLVMAVVKRVSSTYRKV